MEVVNTCLFFPPFKNCQKKKKISSYVQEGFAKFLPGAIRYGCVINPGKFEFLTETLTDL